jgi:hypothetical protein
MAPKVACLSGILSVSELFFIEGLTHGFQAFVCFICKEVFLG